MSQGGGCNGVISSVSLRGHEPSHQYRESGAGEDTAEIHSDMQYP